ncbi:hypothetical protein [Rhodoferax bucti]|uniref:hypothetical protein n=1 Tax=Rhodoferax bucti TaxID=2576305 RepID=UPI001107DF66|nr:hypothetical protein [Rhodoferax bucti]
MRILVIMLAAVVLVACGDKYKDGYQDGYAQGSHDAEVRVRADYEQQLSRIQGELSSKSSSSYSASTQSEVCGGSGVNFNGKHYSGGKTGCVRVLSDGRVERY